MNTLLSLVLCGMMLLTGCESEEARQERILEAVKTKIETNIDNEAYAMLNNKEWYITKKDNCYVVTLTGTVTYIISMPVKIDLTISDDMYITYMEMYVGDECTDFETLPKNENTKLNI